MKSNNNLSIGLVLGSILLFALSMFNLPKSVYSESLPPSENTSDLQIDLWSSDLEKINYTNLKAQVEITDNDSSIVIDTGKVRIDSNSKSNINPKPYMSCSRRDRACVRPPVRPSTVKPNTSETKKNEVTTYENETVLKCQGNTTVQRNTQVTKITGNNRSVNQNSVNSSTDCN